MPAARQIEIIRLGGRAPYRDAWDLQRNRRVAVEEGRLPNALFLVEHSPVITLGRRSKQGHLLRTPEEIRRMGIEVVEADRGGDVTYHGPGQLVAYPVLDLRLWRKSIRWYLRALEEVVIQQLAAYGLPAEREAPYTGVWVNGAKVAAIGVGLHNWVTFHGLALNVNPNLDHFELIIPCGIAEKQVTSLEALLGSAVSMERAAEDFERVFCAVFEVEPC